jgi:SAM-dependent methyltransferase
MNDEATAVAAVLDAIQDSFRDRVAGGVATLPGRPESWGFVGARTADVLEKLQIARRATPARSPRLLECGSGFGFVAALARELGFTVTGVEIDPSYVEMSRRLFPSVRVEEADLCAFDRYGDFDVIYYYGPFADDEVQARFERRVEEALRPGGIVLAARKVTDDWRAGGFDLLATIGVNSFVIQKRVAVDGGSGV